MHRRSQAIVSALILIIGLLLAANFSYWLLARQLSGSDNPASLLDKLLARFSAEEATKKITPPAEITIKVPEGWTNKDIGLYLASIGHWPSADFKNLSDNGSTTLLAQYDFLADKPARSGLEGYLFPDTYRVYASSTAEEIIGKMLDNFDKKLTPQMRADIKKQGKTIFQILIMASIIEKEAPFDYSSSDHRDAKIISGIFWQRLRIGQALQSDATLSYIFQDTKTQHSGAELENNSLYNTYRHRGLPPGPICNPGLAAIDAAIYPQTTPYNYFLTPPDGKTVIYARTYAEHLQNKYKYLK